MYTNRKIWYVSNDTTAHKRQNYVDIINCKSPYAFNNEQNLYFIVTYKRQDIAKFK